MCIHGGEGRMFGEQVSGGGRMTVTDLSIWRDQHGDALQIAAVAD